MEDISFKIDIPADDEGYVLFRCPKCGEFFKIMPSDYYAMIKVLFICHGRSVVQ